MLQLVGKIMELYRKHITFKLKGVILDRIFNLLRDCKIVKLPAKTFCFILTDIRSQILGWRFFVDSINKLHGAGETDDLFFVKSFSIICGYLRSIFQLDVGLMKLLVEQLLVPHFENQSTMVRKQVVLSLAELRFVIEVRLLN